MTIKPFRESDNIARQVEQLCRDGYRKGTSQAPEVLPSIVSRSPLWAAVAGYAALFFVRLNHQSLIGRDDELVFRQDGPDLLRIF